MRSIDHAIRLTESIREGLAAEVALARDERVLIRKMDADGLNKRALKRADFNQRTSGLMSELGEALGAAATELGLSGGVTLEALQTRVPVEGRRMAALLAEVRALAAALAELDSLNRMLGQRALSYVRAHLAVLSPRPAAYDRRGGGAAPSRASTFVKVA
jgi:FlgN protein